MKALSPVVKYFPEMASLGAIGPDMLYFLGDGTSIAAGVADVFQYLNQVTAVLSEVGDMAQQGGFPNTKNRIQQLSSTLKLAVGTSQVGLLASVVKLNNIITGSHLFKPAAAQDDTKSEIDWNWGDLLHDRISGTFATSLLHSARSSSDYPLMAYATGYMTHLATDFVGHPYVNTVVGGPARGWNMRHTIAEKFMDASVFHRDHQDINTSKLHLRFSSLADTSLLDSVCKALESQIKEFTADPTLGYKLPNACTSSDINQAFNSMCSLFRLATEVAYVAPPQGPSIAIPPIPGQSGSLIHKVLGIPSPGRPRTITDWAKLLLALLLLVPSVLLDMERFLVDVAGGVISYPFAAAVYVFQCFVYNIYRQVRWFLVISGVLFPCVDELKNPLARQFTQIPGFADDNDHRSHYPHIPPTINTWTERYKEIVFSANNFDYLNYPATNGETPGTRSSPYPAGATPELFMYSLHRDNDFVKEWLKKATPSEVRELVRKEPFRGGFGNAADLSVLLLSRPDIAARINLDSDRGYAYRQWRCDGGLGTGNLIKERFI